ncbi:MAG: fumarylacetoacetate hydrolase family protein [Pseudoflavonifractor sp.]
MRPPLCSVFASYILGYTCLNDVTARDIQKLDGQWTRGKSMDGFAPMGPWITDEVDPADLKMETRLNGKTVQSSGTALFITKVPELLEFITASMTLEPGDVVTTGTPAGIGPMVSGDTVEVEIEGIGVLRNHVV